jgi:hypothetical protein
MVIYCVTIVIESGVASDWIDWMQRVHVPDVLRTGCFSGCHTYKMLESNDTDPTYVLQYQCPTIEQYHRYRDDFAPELQKNHASRFAGRFRASRQLLQQVAQPTPGKDWS